MSQQSMIKGYDRHMSREGTALYYGRSGFYNYGYWTDTTHSQKEACETLTERLLTFLPERAGNILDVACGLGATTRHLLRYYEPADVTAINISSDQLSQARENAPGCTFLEMDATSLGFDDESFDNVICVEAAFHFSTRERFLREARRVLRPGGRLVVSDILFYPMSPRASELAHIPIENHLEHPDAYGEKLRLAGFSEAQVVDATDACWGGFDRHMQRWPRQEWRAGNLGLFNFLRASVESRFVRAYLRRGVRYYVLACGRK